jgi:hypothetical protein
MAQKRPAPTRGRFQAVNNEGPRPKKRKTGRPKLEVVGKIVRRFSNGAGIKYSVIYKFSPSGFS